MVIVDEETLSLFQKIVGDNFEVRTSEEYEEESAEKRDRCTNPIEAAGFRATMKTLALEVKKAVRKGKNIKETYTDMIRSTIKIAKAMKYPGAASVQTEDILESIKDIECQHLEKTPTGKDDYGTSGFSEGKHEDESPAAEDLLVHTEHAGKRIYRCGSGSNRKTSETIKERR